MAIPTYVNTGATANSINAVSVGLPAGIATDDILLLVIETANQAITVSDSAGGTWTEVTNSPQGTGTAGSTTSTRLTVFWSRYNGTQTAPTISDSTDHQIATISAFRGCTKSGNPYNISSGNVDAVSDTSLSATGATTTVADCLVVICATLMDDAQDFGASWTNADLANITVRSNFSGNAGNDGRGIVVTGEKASSGTYGATTNTLSANSVKGLMTIALVPQLLVNQTWNIRHDVSIFVNRTWNLRHDISILVNQIWNLRHDISQFVNQTWNLRYDISQFVNQTWNLRHDISIFVNRTWNLRHDINAGELVNRIWNLRHDISQFVNQIWNVRSDISQFINQTYNIRHDISNFINRTWNLRHDINNLVNRTWDIRHDISQFINRTWNLRHDISQFVNQTWNLRYDISAFVNNIWNIRHDISNFVTRSWNLRHDILQTVNRTWNLRHDIFMFVNQIWNFRYDMFGSGGIGGVIGRTLDKIRSLDKLITLDKG